MQPLLLSVLARREVVLTLWGNKVCSLSGSYSIFADKSQMQVFGIVGILRSAEMSHVTGWLRCVTESFGNIRTDFELSCDLVFRSHRSSVSP